MLVLRADCLRIFGEAVKRNREEIGWCRADVARIIGLNEADILAVEAGEKADLKFAYVQMLARALGIDLWKVLDGA
ncbi:MAG TPA: hypothetical protein VGG48_19120 [Rhizomicrobium sp.]|jgi:ribosome-binding protein aMBF1 (putative translation factor)